MSIKFELPFEIGQEMWRIDKAYDDLGYRIANTYKINKYIVTDYDRIYFDKPSGEFNYDILTEENRSFAGCTFEISSFYTKEEALQCAKAHGYTIIED